MGRNLFYQYSIDLCFRQNFYANLRCRRKAVFRRPRIDGIRIAVRCNGDGAVCIGAQDLAVAFGKAFERFVVRVTVFIILPAGNDGDSRVHGAEKSMEDDVDEPW